MKLESFGQKNTFSEIEREKSAEFSNIIKKSFGKIETDDDGFEMRANLDNLKMILETNGFNPEDIYLWKLLKVMGEEEKVGDWKEFDVPKGILEIFIKNLSEK